MRRVKWTKIFLLKSGFDSHRRDTYALRMDAAKIKAALADISAEKDPTQKALKMSSLCSAIFREKGVDLVLVGGSAIEAYTEGAYTSGDIDLCISNGVSLDLRS